MNTQVYTGPPSTKLQIDYIKITLTTKSIITRKLSTPTYDHPTPNQNENVKNMTWLSKIEFGAFSDNADLDASAADKSDNDGFHDGENKYEDMAECESDGADSTDYRTRIATACLKKPKPP